MMNNNKNIPISNEDKYLSKNKKSIYNKNFCDSSHRKIVRKNKLSQIKKLKWLEKNKIFEKMGKNLPKIIAIINISPYTNIKLLKEMFLKSSFSNQLLQKGKPNLISVCIGKRNELFITWFPPKDKLAILDISKVADILLFVSTPNPEIKMGKLNFDLGFYDEVPELLKLLKSQGVPYVIPIIQGLFKFNRKEKYVLTKAYNNYFKHEFPNSFNFFSIDDTKQIKEFWSFISLKKHFRVDWRHRSFLLAQSTKFLKNNKQDTDFEIFGYLRGERSLNINHLIHLTGVGDFEIKKIENRNNSLNKKYIDNDISLKKKKSFSLLAVPSKQSVDMIIEKKKYLKENNFSIVEKNINGINKNEIVNRKNIDDRIMDKKQSNLEKKNININKCNSKVQNTMISFKKLKKKKLKWPDEIDTPIEIPAKLRFSKYRGLKSFTNTEWDEKENLPLEYSQIVQISNWKLLVENSKTFFQNGIECNQKICLTLRNVPKNTINLWKKKPCIISTLYKYERKITVMHYILKRRSEYKFPVKTKTTLLFQNGFKRFLSNPIWSVMFSGKKMKCLKYFYPNSIIVASIYGRIEIPPSPTLIFLTGEIKMGNKFSDEIQDLIGTGSVFSGDSYKLLIKRKILTGNPIQVHKRRAVVRYMFFRPDDVLWFSTIELMTKNGLKGQIEEPIGTYGYMKCYFNNVIKGHDIVCLNLYKRQYPKKNPWIWPEEKIKLSID